LPTFTESMFDGQQDNYYLQLQIEHSNLFELSDSESYSMDTNNQHKYLYYICVDDTFKTFEEIGRKLDRYTIERGFVVRKRHIHTCDDGSIWNATWVYTNKRLKNDAADLLNYFLRQKALDPGCIVEPVIGDIDNELRDEYYASEPDFTNTCIKDDYDLQQIYLNSFLYNISHDSIKEAWHIVRLTEDDQKDNQEDDQEVDQEDDQENNQENTIQVTNPKLYKLK
ncbi:2164_t:CDS:2, partial [Racocetra persica]